MSSSPLDEIRRLTAELASAKRTIDRVGQGLSNLERDLAEPSAQRPAAHPARPTYPVPAQPGRPVLMPPRPAMRPHPHTLPPLPLPRPTQQPSAPTQQPSALAAWWQRESAITRVLGVAGALVTLIGMALLLVLAVQQNWFTPTLRVALGTALSVVLVGIAWLIQERRPSPERSSGGVAALAATGHAGLFLVVLASTRLYEWWPTTMGLLIAAIIAMLGIFTALRWRNQAVAIIQVVAIALLAIPLANSTAWAGAFLVLFVAVAAPLSIRGWETFRLVSILTATAIQLIACAVSLATDTDLWLVTLVSSILLVRSLLVGVTDAWRRPPTAIGMICLVVGSVPFLVISTGHTPWTSTALHAATIVLGFGFYLSVPRDRSGTPDGFGWATMAVPTLAWLLLAFAVPLPDGYRAVAMLTAAVLACVAAGILRSEPVATSAAVVSLAALVITVPMVALSLTPFQVQRAPWQPLFVTGVLATLWAGVALWVARRLARVTPLLRVSLVISVVIGLLGAMMATVASGLALGAAIGDVRDGFTSGHAIATITWVIAAAFLLVRGLRRAENADLGIKLALGLAGVAVAKLFLYDLSALDGIWRGAAFVVVGLLLLGLGITYAKALERAKERSNTIPPTASPPERS